jgi:magnesium transporter
MTEPTAPPSIPPGPATGTAASPSDPQPKGVKLTLLEFDATLFKEAVLTAAPEPQYVAASPHVLWLNLDGLTRPDILQHIKESFRLTHLPLADVVNTDQSPKIVDYGEYLHIVLKMLSYDPKADIVIKEHLNLVVSRNFVITLQEHPGDVFEPVRTNLRIDAGPLRKSATDYLAYALLNIILDNYFIILEKLGEGIELLEEKMLSQVDAEYIDQIQGLKRDTIFLWRLFWPLRKTFSYLERGQSAVIGDHTRDNFSDAYDYVINAIETIEMSSP